MFFFAWVLKLRQRKHVMRKAKFKSQFCKFWIRSGSCKLGDDCTFAHTIQELSNPTLPKPKPKKTRIHEEPPHHNTKIHEEPSFKTVEVWGKTSIFDFHEYMAKVHYKSTLQDYTTKVRTS